MAVYEDFDIDRSTAQAWAEFQHRLSEVISMIDDSGDLTIGTESESEDPAPYITLTSPARDRVRCEAASNAVLGEDFQLGVEQLAAMERCGWNPPAVDGAGASTNFWVEDSSESSDRLSELAVSALRDVYGVQHPVFLAPDQLAEVLQPRPEPLTTDPEFDADDVMATVPGSQEHLNDLVDEELIEPLWSTTSPGAPGPLRSSTTSTSRPAGSSSS